MIRGGKGTHLNMLDQSCRPFSIDGWYQPYKTFFSCSLFTTDTDYGANGFGCLRNTVVTVYNDLHKAFCFAESHLSAMEMDRALELLQRP